jgi:hypothetical protein
MLSGIRFQNCDEESSDSMVIFISIWPWPLPFATVLSCNPVLYSHVIPCMLCNHFLLLAIPLEEWVFWLSPLIYWILHLFTISFTNTFGIFIWLSLVVWRLIILNFPIYLINRTPTNLISFSCSNC